MKFLIKTIALLLLCAQAHTAVTLVQVSAPAAIDTVTSTNLVLNGVAAGNTLMTFCGVNSFAGSTTISVDDGGAYTEIVGVGYYSNTARLSIHARQSVTAGNKTATATFSRTVYGRCVLTEWSGLAAINTGTDVPATASANSTSPAVGPTAALSTSNMLIIAGATGGGASWSGATSPSSGYTTIYADLTNAYTASIFNYKVVSATTAVSANWGTIASDNWGAVIAAIPVATLGTPYYYRRRRQ